MAEKQAGRMVEQTLVVETGSPFPSAEIQGWSRYDPRGSARCIPLYFSVLQAQADGWRLILWAQPQPPWTDEDGNDHVEFVWVLTRLVPAEATHG